MARLGRAEEAEVLALRPRRSSKARRPEDAGRAYSLAADVYVELGNPERAQELYEQAAEYLEQSNSDPLPRGGVLQARVAARSRGPARSRVRVRSPRPARRTRRRRVSAPEPASGRLYCGCRAFAPAPL